jgi:hypothetical protein
MDLVLMDSRMAVEMDQCSDFDLLMEPRTVLKMVLCLVVD